MLKEIEILGIQLASACSDVGMSDKAPKFVHTCKYTKAVRHTVLIQEMQYICIVRRLDTRASGLSRLNWTDLFLFSCCFAVNVQLCKHLIGNHICLDLWDF